LLRKIAPAAGTIVQPKAALLFDWDNRWALEDVKALARDTKKYEETCIDIWKAFFRLGMDMDVEGSVITSHLPLVLIVGAADGLHPILIMNFLTLSLQILLANGWLRIKLQSVIPAAKH